MPEKNLIPAEHINQLIIIVREQQVILDRDLASLYGVSTGNLNRAVTRNLDRFPDDFMIQLSPLELRNLIFHFGTSSWGGTRKPPRAFTEQGVAMLSSVLRSERAVLVNIEIMRAFVRLRRILLANADLARKLQSLEKKYDSQFKVVFDAIGEFTASPKKTRRKIGFKVEDIAK
jgi:hypothetical protein